jgi:hypothetical protein
MWRFKAGVDRGQKKGRRKAGLNYSHRRKNSGTNHNRYLGIGQARLPLLPPFPHASPRFE